MLRVARAAMAAEGCEPGTEVTIVIGADKWIRRLNQTYLGKDRATDVLAFPQQVWEGKRFLLGDVAISAQTAERQARALGHSLARELAVLTAHGILHLTGWRDDTPQRRRRMAERVEEVLRMAAAGP